MSAAYEKQRKAYETLQRTVSTLADALEKPMPDLPEPSSVTHTKDGAIVVLTGRVGSQAAATAGFQLVLDCAGQQQSVCQCCAAMYSAAF